MINCLYEPFKKWSEKGSVWIISDPHFDDSDTKIMNENWIDPQEHIDIINSVASKNDTLICLGDCGNVDWFKKIKAEHKVLIRGNHDDKGINHYIKKKFREVYDADYYGRHWKPFNLGKEIKGGLMSGVPTIHRLTIDRAIENPIHKK